MNKRSLHKPNENFPIFHYATIIEVVDSIAQFYTIQTSKLAYNIAASFFYTVRFAGLMNLSIKWLTFVVRI